MEDKKKKATTLWIYNDTRLRMNALKGRGVSADRFLNDLMDIAFPQENEKNEISKEKASSC